MTDLLFAGLQASPACELPEGRDTAWSLFRSLPLAQCTAPMGTQFPAPDG